MRSGRHKMIVLTVEASDTVEKLRGKIGAWAAGSLLMVNGKVMEGGKTVKDYLPDIQAAGLILRMAWPKIWVKVQKSSRKGKSGIHVAIKPSTTAVSVQQQIAARLGIQPEHQCLTIGEQKGQKLVKGCVTAQQIAARLGIPSEHQHPTIGKQEGQKLEEGSTAAQGDIDHVAVLEVADRECLVMEKFRSQETEGARSSGSTSRRSPSRRQMEVRSQRALAVASRAALGWQCELVIAAKRAHASAVRAGAPARRPDDALECPPAEASAAALAVVASRVLGPVLDAARRIASALREVLAAKERVQTIYLREKQAQLCRQAMRRAATIQWEDATTHAWAAWAMKAAAADGAKRTKRVDSSAAVAEAFVAALDAYEHVWARWRDAAIRSEAAAITAWTTWATQAAAAASGRKRAEMVAKAYGAALAAHERMRAARRAAAVCSEAVVWAARATLDPEAAGCCDCADSGGADGGGADNAGADGGGEGRGAAFRGASEDRCRWEVQRRRAAGEVRRARCGG